jgi:deoxyribodipyrimidine photo-lyase
MSIALFIFHRDLRLIDNTSLIECIKEGYKVLPVFIFPPEQINPKKNEYFSNPAVQFMCESLEDLDNQLRKIGSQLYFYEGDILKVLSKILREYPFDSVWFNEDYSKYARDRDQAILDWCKRKDISCEMKEDYSLLPFYECFVKEDKPYEIFSPFYRKFQTYIIPNVNGYKSFKGKFVNPKLKGVLPIENIHTFYNLNQNIAFHGGRTNGLKMLRRIKTIKHYERDRDYPALDQTTHASPHLKFGTISIREMYNEVVCCFGKNHHLIRELAFREFYLRIYGFDPNLQRNIAFHDKLDKKIRWSYSLKNFEKWVNGKTGFPIVDAGMRQLNQTGYQHNRIRMICASFLSKYLLIDWRWGAKYYYQHLIDCDIFSNTAGWGFSSSTGPDPTPYFRAPFNPFIQSKKFDKDAEYIKKWIPELIQVNSEDLHKWYDPNVRENYPEINYPDPMVDYEKASSNALKEFKQTS